MFLDPDPRPTKNAGMGFFAAQNPIASPRDVQRRSINRRAPLQQRTESQNNQSVPIPPTVRLVKPSSSDSSDADDEGEDGNRPDGGGGRRAKLRLTPQSPAEEFETKQGLSASGPNFGVSEAHQPTNEAHHVVLAEDRALHTTLFPNNSQQTLPNPATHRRSTSSGWYSQCSTLKSSEITLAGKSSRSQRSSQVTTLRGTPTPHEYENRARAEGFDDCSEIAGSGSVTALQPLREEKLVTTIRPVPDSDTSSPEEPRPGSQPSEGTLSRCRTAPTESPADFESPPFPRRSRRACSTGSEQTLPSIPNLPEGSSSPIIETYGSDPVTISEGAGSPSPSPIFVAYSPSTASVRPVSHTGPLRGTTSFDSINSRLHQSGSVVRLDTTHSLVTRSSWGSLESSESPPPLYIPKKRLRHRAASESLSSQALASSPSQPDVSMATTEEDIDNLPYPKRPFSNHLSTIASESEGRSTSHHFSHWSYGSGVLTGDDVSIAPLSPINDGRGSAPVESMVSSPGTQRTSLDEPGDMTLGIFREGSAVPQPLFKPQGGPSGAQDGTKRYEGPLPPLPPIPKSRDSDERFDTLSEMARPSLHQKRSGYSLRTRSNTTPGHSRQVSEISYVESERNSVVSQGTGVFPIWARRFYSGAAALPSKLSLNSVSTADAKAMGHRRGASSWTDRSITSRLGQDYVESDSPASSHFLPAIFRPRTRKNSRSNSRSSRIRKSQKSNRSKQSRASQEVRHDSMTIDPDPLPQSQDGGPIETLPSGQPKWGTLKEEDDPTHGRRPLRKYSKQGRWDEMEYPRPMTKDRLSEIHDYGIHGPRLAPSKRTSQNRLSVWNAPSFVESLDTLIYCRCNRQVSLFVLGFLIPFFWMIGAILPLPQRPNSVSDLEKQITGSEDDVQVAMMRHAAGDAEKRWREEKRYLKARWWRMLNRIMSVIGLLLIGAVVALVVIALR